MGSVATGWVLFGAPHPQSFREGVVQARPQVGPVLGDAGLENDDDVYIGRLTLRKSSKPLAHEPLSAIPSHGVADAARGHEPQASPDTVLGVAPMQEQHEVGAMHAQCFALRSQELGALENAVLLRQPLF